MPLDTPTPTPRLGTHYRVVLGVAVVADPDHTGHFDHLAATWTAELRDAQDTQVGSAVVGGSASDALNRLGALLVEHLATHPQED